MAQERVDNLFASESWSAVYTAFTNISLKAYDFDTIREALLNYVAQTYPDKFNDFVASSEFIAILDIVAYLGHSLSFRNDMNTRENFLDVAERRESVLRMAKTLGYNKTRPINSRGFVKITSVKTNQTIYDNNGNSLANRTVIWNNANDAEWYDNFVTVLNASLATGSTVDSPSATFVSSGVENYLHNINENPQFKSVKYTFTAPVASKQRNFEIVRTLFEDDDIIEDMPNISNSMTLISRNDNLGPASDRTGFFMFAKIGKLKFKDVTYTNKLSNRIEQILDANVSNTDVWVQKVDSLGNVINEVQKVDNDTRETAIYHSIKNGNGDLVSVHTLEDNKVELVFSDGIFGNAAYGTYRIWYRVVDNETFRVNRDDVRDVSVTIPYIGKDGNEYKLTLTLKTTIDFTENYEGENYISVKRIAPRSYYAQDRMVNAQDYNVLPLSMGTNVISKLKAVNTSHAGKSRFFEMDDVTGHHSNVHVVGSDGSVYIDDESVKLRLPFNRSNGNIDSFIRNELSNVIKNPSLVNLFYETYMFDENHNLYVDIPWWKDPTNPLRGVLDYDIDTGIQVIEGDYLQITDPNGENPEWYRVLNSVFYEVDQYITLDRIAPDGGDIIKIVKSHRTKFTEEEIANIKQYVISNGYIQPFWIWYENFTWNIWYDGIEEDTGDTTLDTRFDESIVKFKITYIPGFRRNDSEFLISFDGKKIVFDSNKEVKFYYSNGDIVVDQKTNLSKQDKLFINYYSGDATLDSIVTSTENDRLTVGVSPLKSVSYNDTTNTVTFDADFKCLGAVDNLNFINEKPEISEISYSHYLISPDCIEYEVDPADDTVIGTSPNYTVGFDLTDADTYLVQLEEIVTNEVSVTTNDYSLSVEPVYVVGDSANTANTANSISATITVDYNWLKSEFGGNFKGEPDAEYFAQARLNKNFILVDASDISPNTLQNVTSADYGTRSDYLLSIDYTNPTNPTYTFTIPESTTGVEINSLDNDIYFKQFGVSEYSFTHVDPLNTDEIYLKDENGNIIPSDAYTISFDGVDTYTITFWETVYENEIINVYQGTSSSSFDNYLLKVICDFKITSQTKIETQKYEILETYIYDNFITNAGYIDNSKVKILSIDSTGNPYGTLSAFKYSSGSANIVLEKYTVDGIEYEKVSTKAVAALDNEYKPDTATIWYNETDSAWLRRYNGEWVQITPEELTSSTHIIYSGIEYRVVNGRSYIDDQFMNFRWDHYADEDKRIDPSTSNIVDMYVLTTDYVKSINTWVFGGSKGPMPTTPNSYELRKLMKPLMNKASISDHVNFIPAKFKIIFGDNAEVQNQAIFKVVKREGTSYTDSEIKTKVSNKINEYFNLDNWDFGDKFYYSELAAYLHKELSDLVASVVITPKYATTKFTDLLSISCEPNEIFLGVTTSKDVRIVSSITTTELTGE
jgi:hypothetical protein